MTVGVDVAGLVCLLDLPETQSTEELVEFLQARRAFQLECLAVAAPDAVPTASLLRLRASRQEEITLCEASLLALGAAFVAEGLSGE